MVTAGLRCAPLMCPTHWTKVAAANPNAKATFSSPGGSSLSQTVVEPQPGEKMEQIVSKTRGLLHNSSNSVKATRMLKQPNECWEK